MRRLVFALLCLTGCDESATPGDRGACAVDADCAETDVCFDGRCIFQGLPGDQPPPAEPGEPPPPEVEVRFEAFGEPAATDRFVWVASPVTDTVARIDGRDRSIGLVELGDEPTIVRALPDRDAVAVLARGSDEVFRIDHVDGADAVERVRLGHHANALEVGPAGLRAFAWFDLDRARPGEEASALQQVAVIDLDTLVSQTVVVGYRPSRFVFLPDGTALVVTEDGLSVIPPEPAEGPAPIVPLAADIGRVGPREVVVTPDGSHAASRATGEPGITVVALEDGVPRFVDLGAEPTDLDLMPDGRTALAMVPTADRLVLIDLTTDEAPREVSLRGVPLGAAAVGESGRRALLYTTTAPAEAAGLVGLLEPESGALVFSPLRKAARGAVVDAEGRTAIVLHARADGEPDPADPASIVTHSHGYSVVDLDTAFVKLELTPVEPQGLVFSPDGAAAFMRLSSADDPNATTTVRAVQRIDLTGFEVRTWTMGSPPEAIGTLPAIGRVFVTQTHPTGRISFVALDDPAAAVETVTGYVLNGRIE